MADSRQAKSLLREKMTATIAALSEEEKQRQSEVVRGLLYQEKAFIQAKSVAIYVSKDDELQTLEILRHSLG
jgi:5-formyltetrahydrofolate cyclo-ligase